MNHLTSHSIDDLKLVYRVLHGSLMQHIELLDSPFFAELQELLQSTAGAEGVDVTDHAAWDAWLGQAHVPCALRLDGREVLN